MGEAPTQARRTIAPATIAIRRPGSHPVDLGIGAASLASSADGIAVAPCEGSRVGQLYFVLKDSYKLGVPMPEFRFAPSAALQRLPAHAAVYPESKRWQHESLRTTE
jgi:hypothetical protein